MKNCAAIVSLFSLAAAAALLFAVRRRQRRHLLLRHASQFEYVVLWKPWLVLCSWEDDSEKARRKGGERRQTLLDMGIPDGLKNVGRLDRDSEGLLLFTSDGQFNHELTAGGHPKTYWALVEGRPTSDALRHMASGGLVIRGAITRPCRVTALDWAATQAALPEHPVERTRSAADSTWIEVELHEGRNRQVRRVTQAAGHKTLRLVRVGIVKLRLEDLKLQPGEWRRVERGHVL